MALPAAGMLWTFGTALAGWAIKIVKDKIGPIVAALLAWFGVQLAVNEFVVEPIIDEVQGQLSAAPAMFMDVINYVDGGRAIAMVLTAYTVSAAGKVFLRKKPTDAP